jgi:copper(I)-binding protein
MLIHRLAIAIAIALSAAALAAQARDYKLGTLEIAEPWSRATPLTAQAAGGFLAITNRGPTADRLIAARSGVADKVEIHEMKMEGSVMRMRELEAGLAIPPGATVELRPGGFHIMFMGLKAPFAKDTTVPVTLVFEKAGAIDVEFTVQAMGAQPPAAGHKH